MRFRPLAFTPGPMTIPSIIRKLSATVFSAAALLCNSVAEEYKSIVIFAQMPGSEFSTSDEYWANLLAGATTYFQDQFGEGNSFSFVAGPKVTLTKDYSDANVQQAAIEAVRLTNPSVDFVQYDLNHDRLVDNVTIIFSGSAIWPQNNICNQAVGLDGKQFGNYSALSEYFNGEPTRLGIFCHEYGHAIGLPDLYDIDEDGSLGLADALWGSLALMDRGDRNNGCMTPSGLSAVEHDILGIGVRDTLKAGQWQLSPIGTSHNYAVIPTGNSDEYFLLECRSASGWDEYIGGEGLLLYHIDRSANPAGYSTRFGRDLSARERWTLSPSQINCNPFHQCADLMEADSDAKSVEQVFFRSGGISSDTPTALRAWDGSPCELAIKDIQRQEDGSVSFNVIKPIEVNATESYQTCIRISWTLDASVMAGMNSCTVSWSRDGEELGRTDCAAADDGSYAIMISGLEPTQSYLNPSIYKVEIKVSCGDMNYSLERNLATEIFDQRNNRPFMALRNIPRNADGSVAPGTRIPLILNNIPASANVSWFFDEEQITPGQEGTFQAEQSGKLRACIELEDGSTTVITKVINVSGVEDAKR